KLRIDEQRLGFGVTDDESHLFRFEQRVDRASERAELEAGKVGDDVLRAVRHQETDRIALPDSTRRKQTCGTIDRRIKLRVGVASAVRFPEEEIFVWPRLSALFE